MWCLATLHIQRLTAWAAPAANPNNPNAKRPCEVVQADLSRSTSISRQPRARQPSRSEGLDWSADEVIAEPGDACAVVVHEACRRAPQPRRPDRAALRAAACSRLGA